METTTKFHIDRQCRLWVWVLDPHELLHMSEHMYLMSIAVAIRCLLATLCKAMLTGAQLGEQLSGWCARWKCSDNVR